MHVIQSHLTCTCLALAAILSSGCGDSTAPAEPTTPLRVTEFTRGAIEITVSTTGATVDLDPDGYMVWVGNWSYQVGVNGTLTLRALPTGKYSVLLDSLAGNCSVTEINPSVVDVVANHVSPVSFSVSCEIKGTGAAPGWWDY